MTNRQIGRALQTLRPLAAWALNGDNLADLRWLDEVQTRPTDQEIIDAVAAQ